MENDGAKQKAHTIGSIVKEAMLWVATLLFSSFLAAIGAANNALSFMMFVSGIVVLVLVGMQLFSKEKSKGKINRIARPLVFLAVMAVFAVSHHGKEAGVMDFAREAGRKADIICKQKGTCPDMLEGFMPGGHLRGAGDANCSTTMNGYGVIYQKREDHSFLITVDLGGYARFFVSGSPTEPVKDNYFGGS
jgi:hypothetical protein